MATRAPVVIVSGQIEQLQSGEKLGQITGGTATGEAMTQDQFGTNSTKMLPAGDPTFAPGLAASSYIGLIAMYGYLN